MRCYLELTSALKKVKRQTKTCWGHRRACTRNFSRLPCEHDHGMETWPGKDRRGNGGSQCQTCLRSRDQNAHPATVNRMICFKQHQLMALVLNSRRFFGEVDSSVPVALTELEKLQQRTRTCQLSRAQNIKCFFHCHCVWFYSCDGLQRASSTYGLVGYDDCLTRSRSPVQFWLCVIFDWKETILLTRKHNSH
jgi:hypothetical protein